MKYCHQCGSEGRYQIPEGDNRERFVCNVCGAIHYENPRMVTGCLPVYKDQVLLCKRAIEPQYGFWTLPGGFMENGETLEQAAVRETLEEANARVNATRAYTIISVPYINQVHAFFYAELTDLDFHPGIESLEVELFHEADIPWDNIAFRTVAHTLKCYFEDRKSGHLQYHFLDLEPAN